MQDRFAVRGFKGIYNEFGCFFDGGRRMKKQVVRGKPLTVTVDKLTLTKVRVDR